MKIKIFLYLSLISVSFLTNCSNNNQTNQYLKLEGFTQGTTYHITYATHNSINYHDDIENLLKNFDNSLSTYISTSIISRMNNNDPSVEGDNYFAEVYNKSREIYELSDGAFDITVAPLVQAYGFGKTDQHIVNVNIDSLLAIIGMDKISYKNNKIIKKDPRITLDVNAIAQGYSVDIVSKFLESKNIDNYMVEIGGELKAKGINPKGMIWKIGVDRPSENNSVYNRQLFAVIELKDKSLATSGNYRKFKEEDGEKFVHTINPITGKTVKSNLLSATVLANDCMTADALATTFMVIGLEKGKQLANKLQNIDVYFIYSDENGEYQEYFTKGFESILRKL